MAGMRERINRFCLAAAMLVPAAAYGQAEEIVTAKLERYGISALVMRQDGAKAFKHGIALFPGHPGIMKLQEENGRPQYEMRGNMLVRSRRHWLDDETLVAVLDAPSDEWASFTQGFRASPRYGADIGAVLNEISRRYPVAEWTFVGTSGLMVLSAYLWASRYWVYLQGSRSWCTQSSGAASSPNFALDRPGPLLAGLNSEEVRITRFASGAFIRAAWKALMEPSLVPTKVHSATG